MYNFIGVLLCIDEYVRKNGRRFAVNTKKLFQKFIALIIAFIVLIRTDEKFKFNKKNLPELLLRSIFGTMGICVTSMR